MRIFSGSSWGTCEWDRGTMVGPGIAQYFSLHDKVVNLCEGGCSNNRQIDILNNFLQRFTADNNDTFYFIVNSPLIGINHTDLIVDAHSIEESTRWHLSDQLAYADNMAKKYKIKLNLIGGLCDLIDTSTEPYTNLTVAVSSWGQLLNKDYAASIYSYKDLDRLKEYIELNYPDLILEHAKLTGIAYSKRRSMAQFDNFFKYNHPSSLAHRLLRDYLAPGHEDRI